MLFLFVYLTGGNSNAFTSTENTNYFFDVRHEFLQDMLDRFAQFFISPLFTASATEREMQAVHNEHSKNLLTDVWRVSQLIKSQAIESHPYHRFGTGNNDTLNSIPKQKGVDVRDALLAFHAKWYSANIMKLVVVGRESIDILRLWVTNLFSPIVNHNVEQPKFSPHAFEMTFIPPDVPQSVIDTVKLHQVTSDNRVFARKYLEIVPVKDLRSLSLLFPLPATSRLYHSKPTSLLSHMIGHEGKGSILSYLKSKSFANSLSAGIYESFSSFSLFSVSLELTETGLENINEIISIIFAYIKLLGEAKSEEWLRVYEEEKAISEMNFRFKSKENPFSYVSHIAGDMHIYQPEDILTGGYLFQSFDEIVIRYFLSYLAVDNMIAYVCSQQFSGKTTMKEEWYSTDYEPRVFNDSEWAKFSDPQLYSSLHPPEPNEFIATDFSLKSSKNVVFHQAVSALDVTAPVQIGTIENSKCEVWYKLDETFGRPKANLMIKFTSVVAYASPRNAVMTALYARLLEDSLNEFAYPADLAGLSYSIYPTSTGIYVALGGYNHKLSVLTAAIVRRMHDLDVLDERFDVVREQLSRSYKNFAMEQPYQHAMYDETLSIEMNIWHNFEKLDVAQTITSDELRKFIPTLFAYASVTVLAHGNMASEEALNIAKLIHETLSFQPLLPSQIPELRVVKLDDSTRYVRAAKELNPADVNSAIVIAYQIGEDTTTTTAVTEVFAQIAKDSVYNQLRTVEQLGYLVWSGVGTHRGVLYFRIIVQSGVRSPLLLESRAEAFLASFAEELNNMTDDQFKMHVNAVIAKKSESYKTLSQESQNHWHEIQLRRYAFDRRQKEVASLCSLTKVHILQFYKQFLAINGSRAVLAVHIYGKDHVIGALLSVAINQNEVDCEASSSTLELKSSTAMNFSATAVDTAQVVIITDFTDFKRSRPLYPCLV